MLESQSTYGSFSLNPAFGTTSESVSPYYGGVVSGKRLVQKSGSNVSDNGTVSITWTGINSPIMIESFTMAPDTRGLSLSTASPTSRKGPNNTPVQNGPGEADTVFPGSCLLNETAVGNWGANSE